MQLANKIATNSDEVRWPLLLLYKAAFLDFPRLAEMLLSSSCSPEPGGLVEPVSEVTSLILAIRSRSGLCKIKGEAQHS